MPKIVENLPLEGFATMTPRPRRSTDADDYQFVPRPLAAMSKSFRDGFEIHPHHHARDQLVYAVTGVMRVRTATEAWIVPPDRAVYLPAHTVHSISIHGQVEMRTLYIVRDAHDDLPAAPTVLEVSGLLRELVLALIEEPVIYDEQGRGGAVALLILSEIAKAQRLSLVIPMPRDPRLLRVCNALQAIVAGEPISRVAERNGYRSSSAFSAAFRKAMGQPPSSLREAG
jgi:AraC-like DNA-binding protein